MTIPAEAIAEIAALVVRVVPEVAAGIMSALREDAREAVLTEVERNQAALDAAPSVVSQLGTLESAALSRLRAASQARAETVRERYRLAETTEGFLRRLSASGVLTAEEREESRVAHRFVAAALDGRLLLGPEPPSAFEIAAAAIKETA